MADHNKLSGHSAKEGQPVGLSGPSAPPASADMIEAQYEMTTSAALDDAITKRGYISAGEQPNDKVFVGMVMAAGAGAVQAARDARVEAQLYRGIINEPQAAAVILPTDFVSGFTRGLSIDPHLRTFFLNLMLNIVFYPLIIVGNAGNTEPGAVFVIVATFYALAVTFPIVMVCYMLDCRNASGYFNNLLSVEQATVYCRECSAAAPSLRLTVHCYHTKTTTSDSNGTTTTTSSHTVTTHRAHVPVNYNSVLDTSELPELDQCTLTLLQSTMAWSATTESQARFNTIQEEFCQAHMHCDAERTFGREFHIPGFMDSMMVYVDNDFLPYVVKNARNCYTVACFCFPLFGAWLFRVYMAGISVKREAKFHKTLNVF
jgi:hypothetical protein